MDTITVDGKPVRISNPEKLLWPEAGIRKIDYIAFLLRLAPYLLPHAAGRLLTTIRYPDGIPGKHFYQKNKPVAAPAWLEGMFLNSRAALAYWGNLAALEFHACFNYYRNELHPTDIVFDLDPSPGQSFEEVRETALLIRETLSSLGILGWVKTSGATGLQIYLPAGAKYDYPTARKISLFFARYLSEKYPRLITIERLTKKRGSRVYFDYLQMWAAKTIILAYSPRATSKAAVSAPLDWEELKSGAKPGDFTLLNIEDRLKKKGDLFAPLLDKNSAQDFQPLLAYLKRHEP